MLISSKKGEWFELIIPKEWENKTTEQLFKEVWHTPKKQLHLFKMNKEVLLNGQAPLWHNPLKKGDRLHIKLFIELEFNVIPTFMDVETLYEDDHLLIVNKPTGINTHPNIPEQKDTLANGVAFHLQAKGELRQIKHIHRLDRDTSGVILFAKHAFIGSLLDKLLEERKITRTYTAVVKGKVRRKKGTINEPIGRDRHHPTKRRISPNGQAAVTHYELIENNKQISVVKCQLDTGRTHQIRVHLSSIGHPILGDKLYGEDQTEERLYLHAEQLRFVHPFTLEEIHVTCSPPWKIKGALL